MSQEKENIIRTVLKSEITWAVFMIAGVMGFVSTVVLPIQQLQNDVSQIRIDLISLEDLGSRLTSVEKEIIKLQK